MHREFDPTDNPFARRSNLSLYAFTGLLVGLLAADLWPLFARWLAGQGVELPTWQSREVYGTRYATLAAVLGGARALYNSFDGGVKAELAIAVACIAAILLGEPLVAAEVVVIGLVGECLEALTFDRTQRALRGLAELFPIRTWVLRDGREERVLTNQLVVGDTVVVKPGGKIPVDGVVLDGRSAIDAAALTGESLPVEKGPGDAVLAGSVTRNGALTIRADKVSNDTVAGRVMDLTAAALRDKPPVERHADRLARRFLPIVLGLAALAFTVNVLLQLGPLAPATGRPSVGATMRVAAYPALAVLVVACPCPLVLATPAAVVAALGRLAGTGVLIKGGSALERLASVTSIAFDKTGTLTRGELELGDVRPLGPATRDDVLRTAASAEKASEHPIARAILAAVPDAEPVDDFAAHPGAGVTGTLAGVPVVVGTPRLLAERGIDVPAAAVALLDDLAAAGQSPLLVARGGVILGAVGARDTIRPDAAATIAELQALGLNVSVLSGDRTAAARAVGAQLPGVEVHAELLPANKAERIGPTTAFVGDGVNDAPALARAAVGLAVGSGADVAAEAGDIVLMGDPLRPLPLLVRLSRETVTVIRQNIVWFGFGVNFVGVAVTGFLWPLVAGSPDWYERAPLLGVLYHQLGSLLVLLNAMRLLAFERTAPGPLAAVRARYRAFDRWANTLHPDDVLHEVAHRWKPIAATLAALVFVGWVLSGLTQVNADQVGVVRRFGAVRADLPPGLHVRWPWPVEQVTALRPAEVRTVEIGFRLLDDASRARLADARAEQQKLRRPGLPGVSDRDQSWTSAHSEEVAKVTDESLMVTGDGNLVDVLATVRYTVSDPRLFLFGTREPDAVIRSTAEAVLRELAAGQVFLDLLTANRTAFESAAAARLARRLDPALGVSLAGLTLHDLHPPTEVVSAYHEVASAIQKRDRLVNEATADATRAVRRAEEEALRTVRSAEADAARKRADATAARDSFLAWHAARTTLSAAEEADLARERESRTKAGEASAAVAADIDKRRRELLAARRALTDMRLSLAAVAAALAGRDKVIVDADSVPGKRTLYLFDPESLKLPAWMARPPAAGDKEP